MLKSILFGLFSVVIFSIVAVGSTFLTGCGGGEGDTYNTYVESDMMCTPGQSVLCFCPEELRGYQVCNSFGNFDSCRCPKPESDAGAEASPKEDAAVEPDAEADALPGNDAEADVQAEADNDAQADATAEPIVTIQGDNPVNQLVAAGTVGQIFHSATICSKQTVEFRELDYKLLGNMGGDVVANDGTPYFTNIKIMDTDGGNTLMGPMELDSNGLTGAQNIHFTDSFTLKAGECKHITTSLLEGYPVVITGIPTGNLIDMAPEQANPWFFHVLDAQAMDGPFIWSDMSEVPHSSQSSDWTNGYLVEDMSQTQTLTN